MSKKIDIAVEIYNKNSDKPRADVIQKIMDKLSVTRGNASIYYAKAKDRTAAPKATAASKPTKPAKPVKDTGEKADTSKTEASSKPGDDIGATKTETGEKSAPAGGKYANTEARKLIAETINEVPAESVPGFIKASWEKHR